LAAAAHTQRPLTRRGSGRSVSLTTAMTHLGQLQATRSADTEVFYMAGRQLVGLAHKLQAAGWPANTPVYVVSRAGWPDALTSEHPVASLADAAAMHTDRPAVVTVGAGACALRERPQGGRDARYRHAEGAESTRKRPSVDS
jgi:uroporphyrin-III C-methyltransferase